MAHTYTLRGYSPTTPPGRVHPPLPVSEVARLWRLSRTRYTFRGWLRYRLALLTSSERTVRIFRAQVHARYISHTEPLP